MSNSQRTLVTLATYNEIDNIERLVDAVLEEAPGVDVLVVDDNSPDGTGRWAQERSLHDKRVHVLHRPAKLGLGSATVAAMRYAIDHGYRFMVNLDADFSHPPDRIPDLVAGMDRDGKPVMDVMIGSRYVKGGDIEGWPMSRRVMSWLVNFYSRWLLGLSPKDCSGSMRCYRVEVLKKLDFDMMLSRGYSFQEEILWHLKERAARMAEIPITFTNRQVGKSKVSIWEALQAMRVFFKLTLATFRG